MNVRVNIQEHGETSCGMKLDMDYRGVIFYQKNKKCFIPFSGILLKNQMSHELIFIKRFILACIFKPSHL
jgi:hypothetical protein